MSVFDENIQRLIALLRAKGDLKANNTLETLLYIMEGVAERDEAEVKRMICKRLSRFFYIFKEVVSVDVGENGKYRGRIDVILQHKRHNSAVFGIEFKGNHKKTGSSLSDWLEQMKRYANYTWKGFEEHKKIPILSCPSVSFNYLSASKSIFTHHLSHNHTNINSLIAKLFGCGEVRHKNTRIDNYRRLFFSFNNTTIWTDPFTRESHDDFLSIEKYQQLHKIINK